MFYGGHCEFSLYAWSASKRSGTEIKENARSPLEALWKWFSDLRVTSSLCYLWWALDCLLEFANFSRPSQTFVISVPDFTLADAYWTFKMASTKHKTRAIKIGYSFIHILNGCEVALCLLRTIFPSLTRAHERVRAQNVKDFRQTKLDCGIKAPFLLSDVRCFLQVFAKNRLKKRYLKKKNVWW